MFSLTGALARGLEQQQRMQQQRQRLQQQVQSGVAEAAATPSPELLTPLERAVRASAQLSQEERATLQAQAQEAHRASEEPTGPVTWDEFMQQAEQRRQRLNQERQELMRNTPTGTARRIAVQNGEKVFRPYKPPRLTDEQEQERNALRASGQAAYRPDLFTYPEKTREYMLAMEAWEQRKQDCPWHAVKWPTLTTNSGGLSWSSSCWPEQCGTNTDWLEYAHIYLAKGIKEYREQVRIWIPMCKQVLGIADLKDKQEQVKQEVLMQGRLKACAARTGGKNPRKKNCSGAELLLMAKAEHCSIVGDMQLSKVQRQKAEQRNLLQHRIPCVEGLEYVPLNWLLDDTPRWLAFQELCRNPLAARSYVDDYGVKRNLRDASKYQDKLSQLLESKECGS